VTFGIALEQNSDDGRLEENLDDGIEVANARATIAQNRQQNGDLGIEAVAGITDGGGNTARLNGNAAQCTNVFSS
jgi:hypothetical protein